MLTKVLPNCSEQQKADLARNLPQNCIWSIDWWVSHTTSQENEISTTIAWIHCHALFAFVWSELPKILHKHFYIFFRAANAPQCRILCTQNWSIHPMSCIAQLFGQRSNPSPVATGALVGLAPQTTLQVPAQKQSLPAETQIPPIENFLATVLSNPQHWLSTTR